MLKVGELYESRVWLDPEKMPAKVPLVVKITRIGRGGIYYRPIFGKHDDGTEWVGSPMYCQQSEADKYLGQRVTT